MGDARVDERDELTGLIACWELTRELTSLSLGDKGRSTEQQGGGCEGAAATSCSIGLTRKRYVAVGAVPAV
jgi:hypothetical protein